MAWMVAARWWSRERDCERENLTSVTVGLLVLTSGREDFRCSPVGVGCHCWPMGGVGGSMMESGL